jgi:uncharacterized protein GlcG (DUF336 family)
MPRKTKPAPPIDHKTVDHKLIEHSAPFDEPIRVSMREITYAEAMIAIDAAIEKCRQFDIRCTLVVTDTHGTMVALARMDGARYMTDSHATGRAKVGGYFGMPAKDLPFIGEKIVLTDIDDYTMRGFTQGGMPLFRDGELVGGIGCSGGHGKALLGNPDDEVARHAAKLFARKVGRAKTSGR